MTNREQALKYFADDVRFHRMTIIRDDGFNRHLLFNQPGTNNCWFEIVTWGHALVIRGDMGAYIFSRIEDMFEFFRADKRERYGDGINPSYWAEKIEAESRFGGHREFVEEKFTSAVVEYLIEWMREHRADTTKEERRDLWDAVVSDVVNAEGDSLGARKTIAAFDFQHEVKDGLYFSFSDFYGNNFEDYTYHYYWICYAIVWAIQKYDDSKAMDKAA